jgi:hypothetical protein
MNSEWITLKEMPGAQPETIWPTRCSGRGLFLHRSLQQNIWHHRSTASTRSATAAANDQPIWRRSTVPRISARPENPFSTATPLRDQPTFWERLSVGVTLDWKVGRLGMLTLGTQFTTTDVHQSSRLDDLADGTSTTRPLGYDATLAQSAPGAGLRGPRHRRTAARPIATWHSSVKYRHKTAWCGNSMAAVSIRGRPTPIATSTTVFQQRADAECET